MVDVIDNGGHVLYQVLKTEAHAKGLLHKTVIAQLINSERKRLLIRPLANRQDAGQFVSPVGGHVSAGESELDALKREVQEEIGITQFTQLYKGSAVFNRFVCNRQENHLFCLFEIFSEQEPVLGNEATSMQWFTEDELKSAIQQKPQDFGDALYFVLKHFYPILLSV